MNYNLPTGPGYSTVSPVSLQYVKDVYNEEPLDAGAGKIKKLDSDLNKKFLFKAFQRRFRQSLVNGKSDYECFLISKNLLKS